MDRPSYDDYDIEMLYTAGNQFGGTVKSSGCVLFERDYTIKSTYLDESIELYERYMDGASFLNVDFLTANIE